MQRSSVFGRPYLQTAGQAGALAVLYFIAAKLSLAFAIPPGYASPLWAPSGLALAACLLIGPRVWPGIWVGAALVNLAVDQSVLAAVLLGTGNTLEALAGFALLRRWIAIPQRLQAAEDALMFVVAAALCSLVAPTIAAAVLTIDHALPASALLANWFTWWQGDVLGILIVTPLLLTCSARSSVAWTPLRILEAACGLILMTVVAQLVFDTTPRVGGPQVLPYMVLPFILWAALRFGQREVAIAVAMTGGLALWHTIGGRGPLATGTSIQSLSILLGFVATLVVMGLVLGAALEERRGMMLNLRKRQDELESGIRERTLDLERTNRALQDELARRVRLEDGLQETEQRFRLMTENVVDYAIYMFDPHGRVMSWNAGAERNKGYTAREIIGESIARFYPREDAERGAPQRDMEQASLRGRVQNEGWRVRKDGTAFWADVVTTAVRDPDGLLLGFCNVTRDLTERKRYEAEMLRARIAAEQASREKSEFIANMSHELRTPLNSLLILAKLLADNAAGNLTERQVKFAQTIHDSGMDLLSLINDVLDLARIESGAGVSVLIAPLELSALTEYIESTFRQVALAKGLRFEVRRAAEVPRAIETDSQRLQQIVRNLLSNAFKFTRHGGVTFEIGIASSGWPPGHTQLDAGDEAVFFAVRDTGIGIQPERLEHIF
ncbi:MAG TPA: MASE1 domain-containing protein, partial [Burkholderiales bacterium]|nr:MASE1 domain-containing protein [Burkholderiales bacterium]